MASNFSSEIHKSASARPAARGLTFAALWIGSLAAFHVPLAALVGLALSDERYTQIFLVPFISGFLIWRRRERILTGSRYCPEIGVPVVLGGVALGVVRGRWSAPEADLPVAIFAMLLVWIGSAVLCYGTLLLRGTVFPLLFLLLMIPIPAAIMNSAVVALQKGSAEMTAALFKLVGVPHFRNGFRFALPGIDIEIAEECSGIRSSLSLFLSGVLAAHLFLRSSWSQICFALLIVPTVIFKNAVRIATISWLGVYVDRSFFFGNLHRYGGLPFSLLAIAILGSVLLVLRKTEGRDETVASRCA